MDSKWNFLVVELLILLALSLSCWDIPKIRSTCSWFAFVLYSVSFLRVYERKHGDKGYLILRLQNNSDNKSKLEMYNDTARFIGDIEVNPEWQPFEILGISKGLICLRLKEDRGFLILNPTTGLFSEVSEVPPPKMEKGKEKMVLRTKFYGFFYDKQREDYLLLVVSVLSTKGTIHLFSLKALSWEECLLPDTILSELLQLNLESTIIGVGSVQCCCWVILHSRMLVFEIGERTFKFIPWPLHLIGGYTYSLLQLNGQLALVVQLFEMYHITTRAFILHDATKAAQWTQFFQSTTTCMDGLKLAFTKDCHLLVTDTTQQYMMKIKDGVRRLLFNYDGSDEFIAQMFQYHPTLSPVFQCEKDLVKQLAEKYEGANNEKQVADVCELKLE